MLCSVHTRKENSHASGQVELAPAAGEGEHTWELSRPSNTALRHSTGSGTCGAGGRWELFHSIPALLWRVICCHSTTCVRGQQGRLAPLPLRLVTAPGAVAGHQVIVMARGNVPQGRLKFAPADIPWCICPHTIEVEQRADNNPNADTKNPRSKTHMTEMLFKCGFAYLILYMKIRNAHSQAHTKLFPTAPGLFSKGILNNLQLLIKSNWK